MDALYLLLAFVSGGGAMYVGLLVPRLLAKRGHEHSFDHMTSDGRWRCAVCEIAKERGT